MVGVSRKLSKKTGIARPIVFEGDVVGFGCDDLRVELIPCWLARTIIAAKHYSGTFVNNSYLHLGVYAYRELVGVMQWGYALNPNSGRRVVSNTGNREYMELNRLWVHDKMPKNTESRVMSYSIKTIRLLYPQVEWVQTFADERCGGAGIVYQACSFDYIGSHASTFYELDGEWYHKIAMSTKNRGGDKSRHLRANAARAIPHTFNQYRYIKFFNKRARKRLDSSRFKIQPYPKPNRTCSTNTTH